MAQLNVMEARKAFSETVNRVAFGRERIVLERRGKRVAALVPVEDLELYERLLEEYEDRLDIEEADKALAASENQEPVSWEDARKRLGI